MYDYGGLKTKLEWKVAVQWAGEAKQEMEESKQFMWVRVTTTLTLYRPSKHKLTESAFGFGLFVGLCAFNP